MMSALNAAVSADLANWNHNTNAGITFDSSTGFTLPNRVMLSPDTSWIARARWNALSPDDRRGFARICPDFVVELLPPPTASPTPCAKWNTGARPARGRRAAGARLGWLIAPGTESVYIFEPGQPVRPVVGFDQELVAGPVLPGFALELRRLRVSA